MAAATTAEAATLAGAVDMVVAEAAMLVAEAVITAAAATAAEVVTGPVVTGAAASELISAAAVAAEVTGVRCEMLAHSKVLTKSLGRPASFKRLLLC